MSARAVVATLRICGVMLLLAASAGCRGCTVQTKHDKLSDTQKEVAKAEAREAIANPQLVMSSWYRRELKAGYAVDTEEKREGVGLITVTMVETVEPVVHTPMLNSVLYLGLLIFPLVFGIVFAVEVNHKRGAFHSESDKGGIFVEVVLGGTGAAYALAAILAALIHFVSRVVCPLSEGPHSYMPFHYSLFVSQVMVMLLAVAFVIIVYVLIPIVQMCLPTARAPPGRVADPQSRTKLMISGAMKALGTAAFTTLGNQLGGWIGGAVALAISSMLVVLTTPRAAPPPPTDD